MNFSDHLAKNGVRNLFYLTALENLESILQHGILCRNLARQHIKLDISSRQVQRGRKDNFPQVHSYVPLYFASNTPMLYVCASPKRDNRESVILLNISSKVANLGEIYFSDGKTANGANRYTAPGDLAKLNWGIIDNPNPAFLDAWTHVRSSEIFVPKKCDASYIQGVYFQKRLADGWSKIGKIMDDSECSHKIFVENSLTAEKGIW